MKRRLLALSLCLAMSASMVACGGSKDNGSSSSNNEAATSTSTEAASGEEAAPETSAPADFSDIQYNTDPDAIKDLVTYETTVREVESFNILYSQNATDFYVTTNLYDGLLSNDTKGNLVPALATSWEADETAETWTFHLREDATWCDVNGEVKGSVTAQDFVTGLEWVLNPEKNENANTSMPNDMIVGAAEYNSTATLDTTMDEFLATVGIETPDEYTVVYHCTAPTPYFDTVATYACLYPAPSAQIEEMGVEGFRGVEPEGIWYSGPYLLTEYINQNEKVFEPNPNWYGNSDYFRFNSVTVKMVSDGAVAYQLYQTGEIDNIELGESTIATITAAGGDEYNMLSEKLPSKYSYQMHFCFDKHLEDGSKDDNWNKAVANEDFRKALYYGVDLTKYYARVNPINPLKTENNFYTMKGLVSTSDGKDYTDLVKERLGLGDYNGETMVRFDAAKAEEHKAAALEALKAEGVTFPIGIDYYISASSQPALDSATVLKQAFEESLGSDFVTLNIKTYVSSLSQEVRNPKLASFFINGWGADYGDPQNYLFQETLGDDNAYYSAVYSCINDFVNGEEPYSQELMDLYQEFTDMVAAANEIVDDNDARFNAFADAEAFMIEHVLGGIPCYYNIVWQETKINDYSAINAPYGIQSHRYLNWETNVNGYSTADYEAFAAAYNG